MKQVGLHTFFTKGLVLSGMLVLMGVLVSTVFVSHVEGQAVYTVKGQVINSISKKPVEGVTVEISAADKASTAPVVTDANGRFEFPDLGTLQPPYRLDFTKRKYKSKIEQPVSSGANLTVNLEPGNIQTPIAAPQVYSGPRSVRIAWEPNPEYNIAGYNVYRRTVGSTTWERLNSPSSQPYQNYIAGLEYTDTTVRPSTLYQYAFQAVSDVDRYTELSPASEQVKGQWLTVFFPEEVDYKDAGLFLWERNPEDPQEIQVRIPVNSKSVYDVSATSIQIDSELPANLLLDPSTIDVQPSGITVGMMMSANATLQGDKISVRIAASGVEAGSLYGSGTLFNIIAKPNLSVSGTQCGPLHLIPDDAAGNGVRLYDVITGPTTPLDLELEDGELCVTGGCIHGDANNNYIVESADAQYILDYWVKKVSGNNCLKKSGDINLDGLVDSADSSLIQRWLVGKNITPPGVKGLSKSYDEYVQDIMWLADSGSMAAEAILSDVEKADVNVNVWLSDSLTGSAGSQKTISVLADNVSNVAGFNMVLNFDKELAQVNSVQLGSGASGLPLSWNSSDGSLKVSAAGEENLGVKGGGVELLKVQFTMIGAGGDAGLVLAQARINDKYAHVPMFDDPKAPKILKNEPTPGEGENEGEGEGEGEETKRRFIVSCGANDDSGNSLLADIMMVGLVSGFLFVSTKRVKKPSH
ncbi:MAG TPA: carboxypeptidase regulatory-like domain-containing protein [Candidatus Hydrogenedens sp.]|nr:carboxypeptidase regulatory-like domain-containing protein [Candidatus Hydrogenedens sp.]